MIGNPWDAVTDHMAAMNVFMGEKSTSGAEDGKLRSVTSMTVAILFPPPVTTSLTLSLAEIINCTARRAGFYKCVYVIVNVLSVTNWQKNPDRLT